MTICNLEVERNRIKINSGWLGRRATLQTGQWKLRYKEHCRSKKEISRNNHLSFSRRLHLDSPNWNQFYSDYFLNIFKFILVFKVIFLVKSLFVLEVKSLLKVSSKSSFKVKCAARYFTIFVKVNYFTCKAYRIVLHYYYNSLWNYLNF